MPEEINTDMYHFKKVKSVSSTPEWPGLRKAAEELGSGHIILWQHHGIFIGEISSGQINWLGKPDEDEKHIQRVRAFNETTELHFWRQGNHMNGRKREESDSGDETEVNDITMKLRGAVANVMPEMNNEILGIKTRQYIGYHPVTHQAGYVDCRYVDFEEMKRNNRK